MCCGDCCSDHYRVLRKSLHSRTRLRIDWPDNTNKLILYLRKTILHEFISPAEIKFGRDTSSATIGTIYCIEAETGLTVSDVEFSNGKFVSVSEYTELHKIRQLIYQ